PPAIRAMSVAAGPAADLWAQQELEVNGRDLTDLTTSLQPGMSVSGRIVFEPASRTPSPDDVSRLRVTLVPEAGDAPAVASIGSGVDTALGPGGAFVVRGLVPASYRVRVTMPGLRTS